MPLLIVALSTTILLGDNNRLRLKYLSVRKTPSADVTSFGYAEIFCQGFLYELALKRD